MKKRELNALPKKQAELIQAARKLFRLYGSRRVTVEEICRESGVSKMTYYKYFSNKWDMAKTVLDVMFEDLMGRYAAIQKEKMPFREKVEKLLRLNRKHINAIGTSFLNDLMDPDCPAHRHFVAQQLKSRDLSMEFFQNAQKEGHIRKDISMPFLLFLLNQMYELANHPELVQLVPKAEDRIHDLALAFFYGFARSAEKPQLAPPGNRPTRNQPASRKADLIIVGGGPAGLTAACVAAENGLKVTVLERKRTPTHMSRTDSGILSPFNEYTFGQTLTFNPKTKTIGFPSSGFQISYDGLYRDVYGFNIYSSTGRCFTFGERQRQGRNPKTERMGIAVDKEIILEGLLKQAERNGAEIRLGSNVAGIERRGDCLSVWDDDDRFEAPFVIAADGVNSRMAQAMGMNGQRRFIATHVQYNWVLDGLTIPEIEGVGFIFAEYGTFAVSSGYREGLYHVGVSSFKPRDDLPQLLKRFVHHDAVFGPWFAGAKKIGEMSCVVNMFEPLEIPFRDNVFFIGDAAWINEIANPGAILCGWKAANAVTLALANTSSDRDGVTGYLDWWKENFYGPYADKEFKPLEMQDFFEPSEIDYLIGLVKSPLPPTLDFYKLVSGIGGTFAELFPTIEAERPELMAKMMEMVNQMEHAEQAARDAGYPNR